MPRKPRLFVERFFYRTAQYVSGTLSLIGGAAVKLIIDANSGFSGPVVAGLLSYERDQFGERGTMEHLGDLFIYQNISGIKTRPTGTV